MRSADLDRFVTAQQGIYDVALDELRRGRKESHWMWFIFPQIAGLGFSPMAKHYAIADRAEAEAYLAHPLLGPRLSACTDAMLSHAGRAGAETILGGIDALKFRSSMTLFDAVAPSGRFAAAIDAFYEGRPDQRTLALLG